MPVSDSFVNASRRQVCQCWAWRTVAGLIGIEQAKTMACIWEVPVSILNMNRLINPLPFFFVSFFFLFLLFFICGDGIAGGRAEVSGEAVEFFLFFSFVVFLFFFFFSFSFFLRSLFQSQGTI